jgi:hypothetical protein
MAADEVFRRRQEVTDFEDGRCWIRVTLSDVPTKRWVDTFMSFPDRVALADVRVENGGINLVTAAETMIQEVRRVDEIIKATNATVAEEIRAALRHDAERRRRIKELNSELAAGLSS